MPADTYLPQGSSPLHGDASKPYPCAQQATPPGSAWSIHYGYCRTSLDWHPSYALVGSADPRCPQDCQHKAPQHVALMFADVYRSQGNKAAAAMAVAHRESA